MASLAELGEPVPLALLDAPEGDLAVTGLISVSTTNGRPNTRSLLNKRSGTKTVPILRMPPDFFRRFGPRSAETSATPGSKWANLDRLQSISDQVRTTLAKIGPMCATIGPHNLVGLHQTWADLGQIWADIGDTLANADRRP